MQDRNRTIKIASWLGIFGNLILALIKIIVGLISGSMAVVGDGLDSITDVVSFIIVIIAGHIIAKSPDKHHPYGHDRAEAIATIIISFLIFFAGAQLFLSSIRNVLSGAETTTPSLIAIYVTIFSILIKLILAYLQFQAGKKINSAMLIANGKNMLNDIFISLGVLVGLIFTVFLNMPVIDKIAALLIGLWIMKTAVEIFIHTNTELMEGISDSTIYEKIFKAVDRVDGACNPHRTRIRKLANMFVIDLDIEVDENLSVADGHKIAVNVERSVKAIVENVYDITVHVEPRGNYEETERYGVSRDDL